MNRFLIATFSIPLLLLVHSCNHQAPQTDNTSVNSKTPVTVTNITLGTMSDSLSLTAVSSFLKKNSLKSSAAGYVEKVNVRLGDHVNKDQTLFIIKTKESAALSTNALDSILNFNGEFGIHASSSGIITQLEKQEGDYVADGDLLCTIAQESSFIFMLNVPFELNRYILENSPCTILLPDKSTIKGLISSRMPVVDAVSQTQAFLVKALTNRSLPENLIVTIQVAKNVLNHARSLPKEAVLTNESEDNFWVMKLLNDSTAIKVPVVRGIETNSRVEIRTPVFSDTDRILLTGNYGLPDTANILITQPKAQ